MKKAGKSPLLKTRFLTRPDRSPKSGFLHKKIMHESRDGRYVRCIKIIAQIAIYDVKNPQQIKGQNPPNADRGLVLPRRIVVKDIL